MLSSSYLSLLKQEEILLHHNNRSQSATTSSIAPAEWSKILKNGTVAPHTSKIGPTSRPFLFHTEIRETTNETMEAMQHANIARQVIDGIRHLIPEPTEVTPEVEEAPASPAAAFGVTDSNAILPSLISQMTQMQTMMLNMQNNMCGHDGSG